MSRLPREIVVRLKTESNSIIPLRDVLVSLELYCHGAYYYGDLIGLTDDSGTVRITRDRVQQDFDRDQDLFLMDYKVPLDQTDPVVGIVVRGDSDFLTRKKAVEESRMVRPDARAAYARARNAAVQTARTQVELPAAPSDQLAIELSLTSSDS